MVRKATTEAATGTALSLIDPEKVTVDLKGYKLGRRVTTPLVSLTYNAKLYVKVEGEMSSAATASEAKVRDKPMVTVPCIDLETGESITLIVPTVLESSLKRVPGGYVGKSFVVLQGPKMPNKGYFQIELFELEGGR